LKNYSLDIGQGAATWMSPRRAKSLCWLAAKWWLADGGSVFFTRSLGGQCVLIQLHTPTKISHRAKKPKWIFAPKLAVHKTESGNLYSLKSPEISDWSDNFKTFLWSIEKTRAYFASFLKIRFLGRLFSTNQNWILKGVGPQKSANCWNKELTIFYVRWIFLQHYPISLWGSDENFFQNKR